MKKLALIISIFLLFGSFVSAEDYLNMKLYLAPQSGTGAEEDPIRSILNDLIDINQGDWFDEIDNPARKISLCSVHASVQTHAIIQADGRAVLLTPNEITSSAALKETLDAPFTSWPSAWRTAAKTGLEANGISVAWVTETNTLRDVLRYLLRVSVFAQIADYSGSSALKNFLAKNLTAKYSGLTTNQKNTVVSWMAAKGLATGWIESNTTIRQIIHYVMENLGWGKIKFSGEDF
jgi:hypothetical protein